MIDGGLVMKWRHQGAWRGGEGGSVETTRKRKKESEWERGIRRIAFRLCSIKGEITHLLRFFLKTTALIDQTAWMYQPIFNMKYRHQKSITPVFSLSLFLSLLPSAALRRSFSQSLMHLHHHPLLSVSLFLSSFQAIDLPLSLSDMYIMLSAGTSAWQIEESIIFNNYLTFSLCFISFCLL